ncbi:MAG: type II toxin-antitoxin system HipA family toxin, partial [Deltaproteobacteria bacterium]|nr:type II toxin-antitoxin system HipA family toxin [Candidatus Tharpella aukensis]
NPSGKWTNQHQMSINGKRDKFQLADLIAVGESISLPMPGKIIQEIIEVVRNWVQFAEKAGLQKKRVAEIARYHRDGIENQG